MNQNDIAALKKYQESLESFYRLYKRLAENDNNYLGDLAQARANAFGCASLKLDEVAQEQEWWTIEGWS